METLPQFVDIFLGGGQPYGLYFEYERRYKIELGGDDHKDHVFTTTFEYLKRSTLQCFQSIGEFLELERSKEFYEEIVEKTSFKNLKKISDKTQE